ncbi:MAG TPA: protein kinase [Pyrinomonadaceae bacterium]|jgi:serine/threonine protein kinase
MRECSRCEHCYEDQTLVCPDDSTNTKHTLPGGTLLAARYRLEKRLGRGAMGQVYLARDENLITRRVAVKTVRPDLLDDEGMQEGEAVARFEREARSAASIRHPNVVDVTDFGKSPDDVFFMVMEYVEGETLYQLLRREGTLSLHRALEFLRQIVAGVDAAHDEGILHRDLKPANIFILQKRKKDGSLTGDGFVKVGDFGLAKIVGEAASGLTSGSGPASRGIIGTPEYMAPEQIQAGTKLDARADIYALGAIAYHMLGGRPPFTGDFTQIIAQKLMQDPPSLTSLRSDISAEVDSAVRHALAKEADGRPATATEWLQEFSAAVNDTAALAEETESRVVILAPSGAEVYVDDERHGSTGRSGRVILTSIPPGRHVLRVAQAGEKDDERVIEIRADGDEQIIQAQFKGAPSDQLSPSRGGSLGSSAGRPGSTPGVVACAKCGSRFAAGAKFCGRCGNTTFEEVTVEHHVERGSKESPRPGSTQCTRCGSVYAAGIKFCGRCGIAISAAPLAWKAPQPVQLLCPACNTSYPPGTKFCGRCGKSVKT